MRRWLASYFPEVFLGSLVAATAAAEYYFIRTAWPSDWQAEAQAALAGALISAVVATTTLFAKAIVDRLQTRAQHLRRVREKLFVAAYDYACDYLMPLAGAAAEIARHLKTVQARSDDSERRSDALDGAFFNTALYVRLHSALMATIPLDDVARPLGIFLTSPEAEDRVWAVLPQPWVFGINSIKLESIVIHELRCGGADRPHEFIAHSKDPQHGLKAVRCAFEDRLQQLNIAELVDVLSVLNAILNSEVRVMLTGWYPEAYAERARLLANLKNRLSLESRRSLGVFPEEQPD